MYVVTEFGIVNLKGKCVAEHVGADTYFSGKPVNQTYVGVARRGKCDELARIRYLVRVDFRGGDVDSWLRRKSMKSKLKATAGLAGAFVAGMVMATALFGWAAAGSKMPGERNPGRQVTVPNVINPTITDEDIALLRQDLRAKKMEVIGQNMVLSDGEAQKFWPIYNHYVKDLQEVNNQKYALLKQYAHMWGTMTDQDAVIYVRNWLEVDQQVQALRVKYVPAVNQVLPGKKAATFFQLDRRLNMIIDLQLFSQIPLAKVKESNPQ